MRFVADTGIFITQRVDRKPCPLLRNILEPSLRRHDFTALEVLFVLLYRWLCRQKNAVTHGTGKDENEHKDHDPTR